MALLAVDRHRGAGTPLIVLTDGGSSFFEQCIGFGRVDGRAVLFEWAGHGIDTVVMIGGLITSFLMELLIYPVIYLSKRWEVRRHMREEAPAPPAANT